MNIRKVSKYSDELYHSVGKLLPQLTDATFPSKQYFEEMLNSAGITLFVAEAENEVIAGMLTLVSYPILTGRKLWIEDVVVDESYRGQGVGEKLTKTAVEYARNLGAKDVRLTSRPVRVAANNLYKKMGFEIYETNVYKMTL